VTCEAVAPLSTVKGSPHDIVVDCVEERPRRERRVVVRRELRILVVCQVIV
jgi:hypothetical protein